MRYRPFSDKHREEDATLAAADPAAYRQSEEYLALRCGAGSGGGGNGGNGGNGGGHASRVLGGSVYGDGVVEQPEMDPVLFAAAMALDGELEKGRPLTGSPDEGLLAAGRNNMGLLQRDFVRGLGVVGVASALERFGHQWRVDAPAVGNGGGRSSRTLSALVDDGVELFEDFISPHTFFRSLFYISHDENTYLAPYTAFQRDHKLQPYYRKYPSRHAAAAAAAHGGAGVTLFRDVDRIRLTTTIIARHLNLQALRHHKMVTLYFALHSQVDRAWLLRNWALRFDPRELWGPATAPLLEIRDYFGEKIGLYFAWLEFYTKMLVLPLVAGTPFFFTEREGYSLVAFGGFVGLWSTLLMSFWARKNKLLNLWWGTAGHSEVERPRHQFMGKARRGPITDRIEIWHVRDHQVRLLSTRCCCCCCCC